jgi:transposase
MASDLAVVHSNAAGIDIGSREIFVSVGDATVKRFSTFTEGYEEAIKYLQSKGVTTVAMESTGVYWVMLYSMLEDAGLEPWLVNGAHTRNVPGRKSDVSDCQWLQQLHRFGLLHRSAVPGPEIRALRVYVRQRDVLIADAARQIQHMGKALEQMNIKLDTVISSLVSESGLRIIGAILGGERNPEVLVQLCDKRIIQAKRAEVLASLRGTYRAEHIFTLAQALETWQFQQQQIRHCDKEIEKALQTITDDLPPTSSSGPEKRTRHHQPDIENLHGMLERIAMGRNVSAITGISDTTFLKILAETGPDLRRWKNEKHFASWAGLAPCRRQSGKSNRPEYRRNTHRVGQIIRTAVQSLARRPDTPLGAFYHRLKSRHGSRVAMKAMARKVAVLIYRVLVYGMEYVSHGMEKYKQQLELQRINAAQRMAKRCNMQLVPLPLPTCQ